MKDYVVDPLVDSIGFPGVCEKTDNMETPSTLGRLNRLDRVDTSDWLERIFERRNLRKLLIVRV